MLLPIITHPNPLLRKKTRNIRTVTPEIKRLVRNMAETMYHAGGVGLAANQVGEPLNIAIVDVSKEGNQLLVLINPKVLEKSQEKAVQMEGCLSVPGYEGEVERSVTITMKTMNGGNFTVNGFLARAIQHEMDHLNGKLYIDCLYGDTGLRRLESKTPRE